MYNLPYFKEHDKSVVLEFMRQHPFATLIGSTQHYPAATQVPVLMLEREGKLFLQGHFMRQTDHHKAFEKNAHALCLFTGPHSYVSASWYTEPGNASTWNYMSVQAKGLLRFTDEESLRSILEKTTQLFEGNDNSPASYHHLSSAYIDRLIHAIVGFEIEVDSLENTFKLSQNRDAESYRNIITQLKNKDAGASEIAAQMQQRLASLHPSKKV